MISRYPARTRALPLVALALLIGALTLTACQDDDDGNGAADVLRLDNPNFTAPRLPAGTHRFAVRFDEAAVADFDGRDLTTARIFVEVPPQSMRVSVHRGGDTAPGIEETAIQVNSFGQVRRFLDYRLGSPVTITAGEPLWIVAEVELEADQQSVGCDDGPRVEGGDWLWSGDEYLTFRERSGENVNWNIRGLVE